MADEQQQQQQQPPVAGPAVFLAGSLQIQCLRCAEKGRQTILEAGVENPNPDDLDDAPEYAVGCPACTEELGRPVMLRFAIVCGDMVAEIFDDEPPPSTGEAPDLKVIQGAMAPTSSGGGGAGGEGAGDAPGQ